MRGQDIANKVLPGLGYFVAFLISLGGLAFNIGNIGGASMGPQYYFGVDTTTGAAISGILGILPFTSKKMGGVLDNTAKVLGTVMLVLIGYVAFLRIHPLLGLLLTPLFLLIILGLQRLPSSVVL